MLLKYYQELIIHKSQLIKQQVNDVRPKGAIKYHLGSNYYTAEVDNNQSSTRGAVDTNIVVYSRAENIFLSSGSDWYFLMRATREKNKSIAPVVRDFLLNGVRTSPGVCGRVIYTITRLFSSCPWAKCPEIEEKGITLDFNSNFVFLKGNGTR